MIFMLLSYQKNKNKKKPEMEGEMSPHKSNPVTAVAPLCKREAETKGPSFSAQLRVFRFQLQTLPQKSLSTVSCTTTPTAKVKMESLKCQWCPQIFYIALN